MNPRINQLVKSLLKKDTLEQCSLPELQQFAERHPYFGAAQLLLTKKMQKDSPEKYNEQLQKTFLFFHNPLWVEHLLNDTGHAEIIRAKKQESELHSPASIIAGVEGAIENNGSETVLTITPVAEMPEPSPVVDVEIAAAAPVIEQPPAEMPVQKAENPTGKDELLFEPYHTVDYFASQGIKLKEDEKPKDKFGQQLKSFTEWLKMMKRLPVAEIARATEPVAEKKVEEMAEHSLKDREVVTETMAEVWEKQGNAAKAIEIYSKLSLLEPAKSTYFAAKIEDLKKLI